MVAKQDDQGRFVDGGEIIDQIAQGIVRLAQQAQVELDGFDFRQGRQLDVVVQSGQDFFRAVVGEMILHRDGKNEQAFLRLLIFIRTDNLVKICLVTDEITHFATCRKIFHADELVETDGWIDEIPVPERSQVGMDGYAAVALLAQKVRQGMSRSHEIAVVRQAAIGHEQHAAASQKLEFRVARPTTENGNQQFAMAGIG